MPLLSCLTRLRHEIGDLFPPEDQRRIVDHFERFGDLRDCRWLSAIDRDYLGIAAEAGRPLACVETGPRKYHARRFGAGAA